MRVTIHPVDIAVVQSLYHAAWYLNQCALLCTAHERTSIEHVERQAVREPEVPDGSRRLGVARRAARAAQRTAYARKTFSPI